MEFLWMMLLWLLLLGLTFLSAQSSLKSIFYSAEEGTNITVELNRPNNMNLSELHMNCRLLTEPQKKVLDMISGKEQSEIQDAQFRGRVKLHREALKQGQVQLLLTRLTALDSGKYRCEMVANYDRDRGDWRFISTVYFEINVTPNRRSTPAPALPGSQEDQEEIQEDQEEIQEGGAKHESFGQFLFHIVMMGFIIIGSLFFICAAVIRASKKQGHSLLLEDGSAVQKHLTEETLEEVLTSDPVICGQILNL
ncbi:uncharacterized protein LOC110173596 isoform X2 [Boleophthalmus pectinirostris]|uniref:uncharacterized protein LOC110173596 isoform X2 n=1 Tax=Boleophthalmus pectinirostris TaxID=150288 RepID=UPI00242D2025|nr:uncharacterized protein LOC110173596 isoform X2 [Boleophthalmus pectinirostris]